MAPRLSLRSNVVQLLLLVLAVGTLCMLYSIARSQSQGDIIAHVGSFSRVVQREKHMWGEDGLLHVNMAAKHPLPELMEEAERHWKALNARQSKTLVEAVQEYQRRNGYAPPAGFELWWQFAREHNVKLVDEFDQINYDIAPYLALSPATMRSRIDALADMKNSFHINVTDRQTHLYGPRAMQRGSRATLDLCLTFSSALPDLDMHTNGEARVVQWIGEDLRSAAAEKVKAGEYFTDDELRHYENITRNHHTDLKNVCRPEDPVFSLSNVSLTPTFIASHLTYMSPCSNPRAHDAPPLVFDQRATVPRLVPQFVNSKMRPDSGFLLPGPAAPFYTNLLQTPHTWEERRGAEKLFWRGTPVGWTWSKGFARTRPDITFRDGLSAKLALMFGESEQPEIIRRVDVLIEKGGGLATEQFQRQWLNERWMDVGLVGEPISCYAADGTCDEMKQTPMWKKADTSFKGSEKKYVVDVDGYGPSEMFHRYLGWGNVVFKATLYTEWNNNWLIPYYHYIPTQMDYSDVYHHMAFFQGHPLTGAGAHEELAAKISQHASTFAREYWRWEDMQAYMFRLLLEYARLASNDREAASFQGQREL